MKKFYLGTLVLSFSLLSSSLYSKGRNYERGGQKPKTPPFVTACESKEIGDTCSFSDRDRTQISGVCKEMPKPQRGRQISENNNDTEKVCYEKNFFDEMEKRRASRPHDGKGPRNINENEN